MEARHSVLIVFGVCLGLCLCEAGARALLWRDYRRALAQGVDPGQAQTVAEEAWTRYDPLLGWSHIPGWRKHRAGPSLAIDSLGFRGTEDYAVPKPAGARRIAILGDSFTFGADVGDDENYPALLARLLKGRAEVVNMGVSAYGIDQMALHFERDGAPLEPDLVVLGVILDDLFRADRSVWVSGHGKPKFVLDGGNLALLNVPPPPRIPPGRLLRAPEPSLKAVLGLAPVLPGFLAGRRLKFFEPAPEQMTPLHEAIIKRVRDDALRARAGFALLLLGWRHQVENPPAARTSLLALCAKEGIPVIDLYPVLRALPPDLLPGHPRPLGHLAIAKALFEELSRRRLLPAASRPGAAEVRAWEVAARRSMLVQMVPSMGVDAGPRGTPLRPVEHPAPRPAPRPVPTPATDPAAKAAALRDLANAALAGGDRPAALRAARALEPFAGEPADERDLAKLYAAAGDLPGALRVLRRLTDAHPEFAPAWLDEADIQRRAGDLAGAAASAARWRPDAAGDAEAHRAALLFEELGDRRGARALLDALAARLPRDASVLADRALCEFESGEGSLAAADLERAIDLDPSRLASYLSLGAVYESQGRESDARRVYRRALALPASPGDAALRDALEKTRH
jgi:tetratricopeptide (TPR) repeat protein